MEVKIRYGFYFVTLVMVIYSYYISPQRFSNKKKCKRLLPFKCNLVWYALMCILIALEGVFLYYLQEAPMPKCLPDSQNIFCYPKKIVISLNDL